MRKRLGLPVGHLYNGQGGAEPGREGGGLPYGGDGDAHRLA